MCIKYLREIYFTIANTWFQYILVANSGVFLSE